MLSKIHKIFFFAPAIFWAILILVLSLLPGKSMPNISLPDLFAIDKLGHFIFYGIFITLALIGNLKTFKQAFYIKIFMLVILYGCCMEGMQYYFLPDRYFEVLDIIANIMGSLVGLLVFYLIIK